MNKVLLLCLAAILSSCSSSPIEISKQVSRYGELNSYYVYSRDNPRQPTRIYPTVQSVNLDTRTFRSKVVLLVHDHGEMLGTSLDTVVTDALLSTEDVTVIVVDWSLVASQPYANAVAQVANIGANIAELIRILLQYRRFTLANLHLVGFGLGAHIVGYAARSTNGDVARITGLDPSRMEGILNTGHLKASDAAYVEVIHTDGQGDEAIGVGIPLGHVDFFPNGGTDQPGCRDNACNHRRAYELFAASITHESRIGNRCPSDVVPSLNDCHGFTLGMGTNNLVKYGSGSYFLETGRTYPYSITLDLIPDVPDEL
uniref:Lipase domain-containing protein n=1 Tax=Pectinophora gossypiella TaxID=13191 RepID=A0A1E1W1Y4_PECGO